MAHPLINLFAPHPHNNHKPKLLWTQSLFILMGLYIMGRSIIDISVALNPGVLGYASKIDAAEVIKLTNDRRLNAGSGVVRPNETLNQAAQAKVDNMFNKNYWAHVSPDGTEPWYFVSQAGYKYLHAGENLARDFTNPRDVVAAWMASPSHKKNLLDSRYKDIGVAVKDGYINGVETTIVVQMFGTPQPKTPVGKIAASNISVEPAYASEPTSESSVISPLDLSKIWSLAFAILILATLSLDWIYILRYNIIRVSSKSWAHLTFFGFIAIAIFIIKQGIVL